MIRGLRFQIPQSTTNTLWKILKGTDISSYNWYNIEEQNEVWTAPGGKDFFDSAFYPGEVFQEQIKLEHFIAFLKLQAYKKGAAFSAIHTFDEFLKSDCQVLLLIFDCEFAEIYVQDSACAEIIYQNAKSEHFENLAYITEDNDDRTVMDVI